MFTDERFFLYVIAKFSTVVQLSFLWLNNVILNYILGVCFVCFYANHVVKL